MKIIHHNENIDLEKLINQSFSTCIGLDISDFQNFTETGTEVHTFVAIEKGESRIKMGLEKILKDDEFQSILHNAKSFMFIFGYSQDSQHLLSVKEVQESNEILDRYFSDKDVLWGLVNDNELKVSSIKIIVLAKI